MVAESNETHCVHVDCQKGGPAISKERLRRIKLEYSGDVEDLFVGNQAF